MPTYSYRCTECSTAFDISQAFTDDSLTECPTCHGKLRKVFSAVGVTFNGSGFYRTDSRASVAKSGANSSSDAKGDSSSSSSSSSSGDAKSGSSGSSAAASTPSAAPAATPAAT